MPNRDSLKSTQGKTGGFTKEHCAVCQRTTWHYRFRGSEEPPRCGSHSPWPPSSAMRRMLTPPSAIVQAGTMQAPYKMPSIKRDRRPVKVPQVWEHAYTFNDHGREVKIECGRCGTPTLLWGGEQVLVGRWLRVRVKTRLPDGTEEIVLKSIPRVRRVIGCDHCRLAFSLMTQLAAEADKKAGKTGKTLVFLPELG